MSVPSTAETLRGAAIDAVVAASRVCREVQARLVAGTSLQKGDKSPVTVADFAEGRGWSVEREAERREPGSAALVTVGVVSLIRLLIVSSS